MNTAGIPVEFLFTFYDDPPNAPDNSHSLVSGVVFTGTVRVHVAWRDVNGGPAAHEADLPSPVDLGLLLSGNRPPRPAGAVCIMDRHDVILAAFSWDIDTREYMDGPHTLTVGDAVWMRHYPGTVAGILEGARTISLPVVIANGQTTDG